MILHTCPKCQASSFYSGSLSGEVNCQSCGAPFTLSKFTRMEKDGLTRLVESAHQKAMLVRSSRKLIYVGGGIVSIFVLWFAVSVFGVVPDEWRLINRRFATLQDQGGLTEAIGLVAAGMVAAGSSDTKAAPVFSGFFTATSISNDGYMITSREVAEAWPQDLWVFIGGRRLDAVIVGGDKIADFAVIKVDAPLRLRFRLGAPGVLSHLNADVQAIGYAPLDGDVRSPVDWPLGITRGSVSRRYSDDLGTEWIEHSAPLGDRSTGGPLIFRDWVVGINVESRAGITRAVAMGPYREKIFRMIDDWERLKRKAAEGN